MPYREIKENALPPNLQWEGYLTQGVEISYADPSDHAPGRGALFRRTIGRDGTRYFRRVGPAARTPKIPFL